MRNSLVILLIATIFFAPAGIRSQEGPPPPETGPAIKPPVPPLLGPEERSSDLRNQGSSPRRGGRKVERGSYSEGTEPPAERPSSSEATPPPGVQRPLWEQLHPQEKKRAREALEALRKAQEKEGRLAGEIQERERKLQDTEKKKQELEKELAEARKRLQKAREAFEGAKRRVEELEKELAEARSQLEKARKEGIKAGHTGIEVSNLWERVKHLEEELAQARRAALEAESRLYSPEEWEKVLKERLQKARDEEEKAKKTYEGSYKTELERRYEEAQKKVKLLEEARTKALRKFWDAGPKGRKEGGAKTVAEGERRLRELVDSSARARQRLQELKKERAAVRKIREKAGRSWGELQKTARARLEAVEKLKKSLKEWEKASKEKDKALESLKESAEEFDDANEEFLEVKKDLERRRQALEGMKKVLGVAYWMQFYVGQRTGVTVDATGALSLGGHALNLIEALVLPDVETLPKTSEGYYDLGRLPGAYHHLYRFAEAANKLKEAHDILSQDQKTHRKRQEEEKKAWDRVEKLRDRARSLGAILPEGWFGEQGSR